MRSLSPTRLFGFLFHDVARQTEIISALNLMAWGFVIIATPQILDRDSYEQFRSLPALAWTAIFLTIGTIQIVGMLSGHPMSPTFRFVGMALASGCWLAIFVAFASTSILTTATATYGLLFLSTAFSGGYLGWKSS